MDFLFCEKSFLVLLLFLPICTMNIGNVSQSSSLALFGQCLNKDYLGKKIENIYISLIELHNFISKIWLKVCNIAEAF